MTPNDNSTINDMQRYLVEEEAEKWQDGHITRREFVRRATLIIGSAPLAAGVLLSMGCDPNAQDATPTAVSAPAATMPPSASDATPTAASGGESTSPDHVAEDDPDIRVEKVSIPSKDASVKLIGYLAAPAIPTMGIARPAAVLVIHENRGLTEHIKDVVRRLAKARYTALCVDLVSRQGGSEAHPDESERTGILGQMTPDQVIADLSAGLDYLGSRGDASPERLGVVGFCFGGGYTWRIATQRPDLKAGVAFYGPNPPLEDVPKIKAAMLGIYGSLDTRITSTVPQLEDALKNAGVTYEIKIYDGADHAFHNDTGSRYKPDAAKDAWAKTLEWFGKYL